MKELTLEELLKIAGGVPLPAALDELTYRAPQEEGRDPLSDFDLINSELAKFAPDVVIVSAHPNLAPVTASHLAHVVARHERL